MYLITGTYYTEGKSKCNEIVSIFTSNSLTEPVLTVPDRRREFCVHLVGKNQM